MIRYVIHAIKDGCVQKHYQILIITLIRSTHLVGPFCKYSLEQPWKDGPQ